MLGASSRGRGKFKCKFKFKGNSAEVRFDNWGMELFDHERMKVYRLALEFDTVVMGLMPRRGCRVVRDQMERSSLGILLNIAEGAGRRSPAEKRHFYAIARGSSTESAAILDVLRARKALSDEDFATCRTLLLNIVRILSKLSTPPLEPELALELPPSP